MVLQCISCPRTFNSGAALNFHTKKIHSYQDSSSTKIENAPGRKKSAIRMLEFGDLKGVTDESRDPFTLGTVKLKVNPKTNKKEVFLELPLPRYTLTSSSKDQTKNNRNLKRKSTSSDSEDSDCDDNESPVKSFKGSPSMPKLVPQIDIVPSRNPKKSKKAKYTQDEDEGQESTSRPTKSTVKKITVSENAASSPSSLGSNQRGSLHTDSSTEKPQVLPPASDKKRTRNARKISGGSSSQHSGTSVSGDDNVSTASSSIPKSGAGRPKSSKTTTCQVCGQTGFKNPGHFTNHLEIHEGKRPYLCPVCCMGYETDLKLLEHVSIRHSQEGMFKCNACEHEYKTERGLRKHRCNK